MEFLVFKQGKDQKYIKNKCEKTFWTSFHSYEPKPLDILPP